jgi:hypothetical protein
VYPTLGGGARVQFVWTYGDAAVCTQAAVVPDTVLRKDVKAAPTPPPVRDRINRVRHRGGEAGASRGYGGVQVQEVLVEKVEKAARVVGSQLNRLHSMAAQSGKRFDDLHIEMRSRTKVNRTSRAIPDIGCGPASTRALLVACTRSNQPILHTPFKHCVGEQGDLDTRHAGFGIGPPREAASRRVCDTSPLDMRRSARRWPRM